MATRNACHVSLGMREPRCFPDRYKSGSCGPAPVRRRGDTPQPAGNQRPEPAAPPQARRRAMFARVITAQAGAEGFDGTIRLAKQQLPGARQQPGFKGYNLLTDAETGKLVIISL
jgi:hypothetical protein